MNTATTAHRVRAALAAAALLALAGCASRRYHRPDAPTPAAYKEAAAWETAAPGDALPRGNWWELFGDARLNGLEERVQVSNQDLKRAEAQYQQARALAAGSRANYYPVISAQASASRQNYAPGLPGRGVYDIFSLPVTASWEPDLWGQVRYAVRGAQAQAQASAAQLANAGLSLQAELAVNYFTLESFDMELEILNTAAASYEESLRLTRVRFQDGIANETDVAQAQAQLAATRAQATDLALARAQLEHAIAVLAGEPASTFSLSTGAILGVPPAIPAGLPARLLERRPDIASAERLVAAANAEIGLAHAAYFPAVTLSALGGFESGSFADWLSWPNRVWALGASAAGTIFDFGRRRAKVRQAGAAYDAAVAAYRQTVLAAFQETEDNLAALAYLEREAAQQDAAVKAAEDSLRLEQLRYKAGTVNYLDLVVTQNIALTSRRAAAQLLGRRMTAATALIRALGGGWDATQLPPGTK